MTTETTLSRRGQLDRLHQQAGAEWKPSGDGAGAWEYAAGGDPGRCGFSDLTPLPRIGLKGWRLWEFLAKHGLTCPEINNTAVRQRNGSLCLRLGDSEALFLADLSGTPSFEDIPADSEHAEGVFLVPRRETHAWLLLTGDCAPSVLAKLCGVDLRPHKFRQQRIAQTIVAGLSAVVLRHDAGLCLGYHILTDTFSVAYLWQALIAATEEYGGGPVGLLSLRESLCR